MELDIKLDNSYMTISKTYNAELHIQMTTDIDDVKQILNSIYDVMNMDDFISTLNDDQMQEISEHYKKA